MGESSKIFLWMGERKVDIMYDVMIIGAGVSGCACARELSRYRLNICVLEREEDVCCGTSKANSAIVHAGFDAKSGSLMAKLNVEGNQRMEELSRELDFPFQRNGSLVVCFEPDGVPDLEALYERGIRNGVKELRIIERDELVELEPNISDHAIKALYAPTGGIVCPFGMNFAFAENAAANGVEFQFDTEVIGLEKQEACWKIKTSQLSGRISVQVCGECSRCVCRCAPQYGKSRKTSDYSKKGKLLPAGSFCKRLCEPYSISATRQIWQRGADHAYRTWKYPDRANSGRY